MAFFPGSVKGVIVFVEVDNESPFYSQCSAAMQVGRVYVLHFTITSAE